MARKPQTRSATEQETQAAIVDAIALCGLEVLHTSAFRQKGSSGVSKGLPDLFIVHPGMPWTYMGIEVKKPGPIKWSSIEQEIAGTSLRFATAQSPVEALTAIRAWLLDVTRSHLPHDCIWKIENVLWSLQ